MSGDYQKLMQKALKETNDFFSNEAIKVYDRESQKEFLVSNYQFTRYLNHVVVTSPLFNQIFTTILRDMLGKRK